MAILRCTLKLRDGRVHVGYTPAFDPADRSLWLTATPDSPAGTMFTLERVRVLVLESLDGRPVPLPAGTPSDDAAPPVRLSFADGEVLPARQQADVAGLGLWVTPPGRGRARAFVPREAPRAVEPVSAASDDEWAFLPPPPTLPPSRSSMTMPVLRPVRDDSMPPPSRQLTPSESGAGVLRDQTVSTGPIGGGDATPTDAIAAVSPRDLEEQHTQPVLLPLTPPPAPPSAVSPPAVSQTWPDGLGPDNTSSITTPDLARPNLDE